MDEDRRPDAGEPDAGSDEGDDGWHDGDASEDGSGGSDDGAASDDDGYSEWSDDGAASDDDGYSEWSDDGDASTEGGAPADAGVGGRQFVTPLRTAIEEHRPYVLLSAGLFALGVVIGLGMVGRVDLFATLGVQDVRQLFPEDISAVTILVNNTRAAIILVLGALSLGVVTALVLVFNGVLVGYIAGVVAAERGVGFVLLAVVPHGLVELPAIFVAGAVAFRIVHATALRVVGRREAVLGRNGWRRTGLLLGTTWIGLVVAAIVEFHVTPRILEAVGVV